MSIMDNDMTWRSVRYCMIGVGWFCAGKGWFGPAVQPGDIEPIVDQLLGPLGTIVGSAGIIWGVMVSRRTKLVPIETAKRADVETVNPVTGKIEPPTKIQNNGL
jgi:multidrug efflux pump subunit AcrA (membrane-fusion protein)